MKVDTFERWNFTQITTLIIVYDKINHFAKTFRCFYGISQKLHVQLQIFTLFENVLIGLVRRNRWRYCSSAVESNSLSHQYLVLFLRRQYLDLKRWYGARKNLVITILGGAGQPLSALFSIINDNINQRSYNTPPLRKFSNHFYVLSNHKVIIFLFNNRPNKCSHCV